MLSPTLTITRTVFDGMNRPLSVWVGTNDTGATDTNPNNSGTAPNNMVKISENVYDGAIDTPGTAAIGDGNLTQSSAWVSSSSSRITQHFYDWRNRLVATKTAPTGSPSTENVDVQRSVTYNEYDNLNQAIAREYYDGDTVEITATNGVPNRPPSGRLRAKTTTEFDEQGRVFRTYTFSVNQDTGEVAANRLQSNTWHDRRGQVIKTSEPGGLIYKTQYDGPGRAIKTFVSDGGGDSDGTTDYDDAWHATGDKVLLQTDTTYDPNGNPTLVKSRQRFHDESATDELKDPANAPKARVSYVASYYDDADRLTDMVDVGTNGGAAYIPPESPPARSDTALVTSYGYKADEVQTVTITGMPTGGNFSLTFCNPTCQTTAPPDIAYNATGGAGAKQIGSAVEHRSEQRLRYRAQRRTLARSFCGHVRRDQRGHDDCHLEHNRRHCHDRDAIGRRRYGPSTKDGRSSRRL